MGSISLLSQAQNPCAPSQLESCELLFLFRSLLIAHITRTLHLGSSPFGVLWVGEAALQVQFDYIATLKQRRFLLGSPSDLVSPF